MQIDQEQTIDAHLEGDEHGARIAGASGQLDEGGFELLRAASLIVAAQLMAADLGRRHAIEAWMAAELNRLAILLGVAEDLLDRAAGLVAAGHDGLLQVDAGAAEPDA